MRSRLHKDKKQPRSIGEPSGGLKVATAFAVATASGSVNEYQLRLGRQKQAGMVHSVSG